MAKNDCKHLPQIEWFYDRYIYPFIGKADLKALIEMRKEYISTTDFKYYNKDARNTRHQYIDCIEQCIKILLSNPSPEFAINELNKQREENKRKQDELFNRILKRHSKKV